MKRYTLLIGFVACMSVSLMHAQQDGSQLLFERFENRFQELDSLMFTSSEYSVLDDSTIFFQHWIVGEQYAANNDSLVDAQVQAEVRALKHQTGLALTGQTYYRLDDGLAIDEDDAVSRYNAKVQVELRWNFLNSSLIHRKGRVHEIELQGDIQRLALSKDNVARQVAEHQDYFRAKYDSLLAGILQHRLYNLTLMNEAQMFLLEHGNISSDELLTNINDKAEAERNLMAIAKNYPAANSLSKPSGFVVEIDSLALIDYVRQHHPDLHLLQLQSEMLMQQMQNETYWQRLNISPFVRYSYYFRTNLPNSSNVDLGINFNIPLTGETAKKRAAMDAERMVMQAEFQQVEQKILENIRVVLLDIQRLNRISLAELDRMEDLKRYLQIRSNAYTNRKGEYNIILRTKEYNTYLLCWEKFLSYQYQRDCLLMTLQTYIPEISVFDFCVGTVI